MRKKVLIYVQAYNAEKTLERCIEECIQIEEDIKTGKIGDQIGVEALICKLLLP